MRVFLLSIAIAFGLVALIANPGHGQTVSHSANPGMLHEILDISGFMTTGEDMGPMRVTAHYSADFMGASESVFWLPGVAGSQSGSAAGAMGWLLDETGDTFDSLWRLSGAVSTNLTLFGLVLEGFPVSDQPILERGVVFDRTSPFFGTDGSYRGRDLELFASAGSWSHVDVEYFDVIESQAHNPPGPVGDIYRAMSIRFGNLVDDEFQPAPFMAGDELLFLQDTDTVGERIPNGDPGDEGVPEPASALLVLIGGLFAAGIARRR